MRQIANQYLFNAAQQRVTILGLNVPISRLESIVNSTRNQKIWDRPSYLGTVSYSSGNTVVVLDFDTAGFEDSDFLTIYYDDGRSGEESVSISYLDKIGGAEPAEWLKKGSTARLPVDVGGASLSFGDITASFPDRQKISHNTSDVTNSNRFPVDARGSSGVLTVVMGVAPQASASVLPAQSGRRYLFIQNLSLSPIYVNFSQDATTSSLRIDAGAALLYENTFVPTNEIFLLGTTANQNYYITYS